MTRTLPLDRPLIVGFGLAGQAVARALLTRSAVAEAGLDLAVIDDAPSTAAADQARALGLALTGTPSAEALGAFVAERTAVLPSPGIPDAHPVFAAARDGGVPVFGEFDLVDAWDERPLVVITGTDGKTTVTTMVTEMLRRSGQQVVDAGNNDLPLVTAIEDPRIERFVVEASSFRLGHTAAFRPSVGVWLNFAPDHLDSHASLKAYEAAKAKLFELLPTTGVAIVNADDPVVARHRPGQCRVVTFSIQPGGEAGYHLAGDSLRKPDGSVLLEVAELPRALPHDLANALAASAAALESGASLDAVQQVLRTFTGLPHRVERVGEWNGVAWYDDSKATTPHATLTALGGFPSVVLIAGGSDKGADLGVLAGAADHVRAVVTIGVTGPQIGRAFAELRPTHAADDMADAVRIAGELAGPGDVVLLSPACASYDMFDGYHHRGEVFAAAVRSRHAAQPSTADPPAGRPPAGTVSA